MTLSKEQQERIKANRLKALQKLNQKRNQNPKCLHSTTISSPTATSPSKVLQDLELDPNLFRYYYGKPCAEQGTSHDLLTNQKNLQNLKLIKKLLRNASSSNQMFKRFNIQTTDTDALNIPSANQSNQESSQSANSLDLRGMRFKVRYAIVVDFEAQCWSTTDEDYPEIFINEIS